MFYVLIFFFKNCWFSVSLRGLFMILFILLALSIIFSPLFRFIRWNKIITFYSLLLLFLYLSFFLFPLLFLLLLLPFFFSSSLFFNRHWPLWNFIYDLFSCSSWMFCYYYNDCLMGEGGSGRDWELGLISCNRRKGGGKM